MLPPSTCYRVDLLIRQQSKWKHSLRNRSLDELAWDQRRCCVLLLHICNVLYLIHICIHYYACFLQSGFPSSRIVTFSRSCRLNLARWRHCVRILSSFANPEGSHCRSLTSLLFLDSQLFLTHRNQSYMAQFLQKLACWQTFVSHCFVWGAIVSERHHRCWAKFKYCTQYLSFLHYSFHLQRLYGWKTTILEGRYLRRWDYCRF